MDYFLTEEQIALRDLVRKIADEKVRPIAAQLDREGTFSWDLVKVFAEAGLYGVVIPEEYGGTGQGVFELAIVSEELAKACAGVTLAVAASALGMFPISISGTEEQRRRYLPELAEGKHLAAFCLTEPEAGSDAGALRTRAVRDGDHYVLNGTKVFITNGGVAHIYTVIALTNPEKGTRGTSAFIVQDDFPGFKLGKEEDPSC